MRVLILSLAACLLTGTVLSQTTNTNSLLGGLIIGGLAGAFIQNQRIRNRRQDALEEQLLLGGGFGGGFGGRPFRPLGFHRRPYYFGDSFGFGGRGGFFRQLFWIILFVCPSVHVMAQSLMGIFNDINPFYGVTGYQLDPGSAGIAPPLMILDPPTIDPGFSTGFMVPSQLYGYASSIGNVLAGSGLMNFPYYSGDFSQNLGPLFNVQRLGGGPTNQNVNAFSNPDRRQLQQQFDNAFRGAVTANNQRPDWDNQNFWLNQAFGRNNWN
ncbi:hypothetical protein FSP39_012140 [Pinctada imbricata]|uniref:Uncharacterized protein n=1 Tax=Pinctada imbricata TaxID=66713 RepID=A0AA88Y3A5_PINIB|nr:hypothetical protein FSP39_012140 [Pinctada imbricata]